MNKKKKNKKLDRKSRQQLYKDLNIEALEYIYKESEEETKEEYKKQKDNRDNLLSDVAMIILTYTVVDTCMKLSNKDINKIKADLYNKVSTRCSKEYKSELNKINKMLPKLAKEKYNLKSYIMSLGDKEFNATPVDNNFIESIINKSVDGKKWSDRLWDNKLGLEKDLKTMINNFLNGEINVNDIYNHINNLYSKNAYNTKRLVDTEVSRVQAESDNKFFNDNDIQKVAFLTELDDKTCPECSQYENKIYDINDNTKPEIPLHPCCRCCYVDVVSKWIPMDNIDVHIDIANYENWKKNHK